jgi:two-component system, NarL family, response regulator DesR
VLILTTFGRPGYLRRAIAGGPACFMLKGAPASAPAGAIRRAAAGERVVDPGLAAAAALQRGLPLPLLTSEVVIDAPSRGRVAGAGRP